MFRRFIKISEQFLSSHASFKIKEIITEKKKRIVYQGITLCGERKIRKIKN